MKSEPSAPPSPESRISGRIERVDNEFSQWKPSTLYLWLGVVILVLVGIYGTMLFYQEIAVRFAIAAAGIAVILTMAQIMLDQIESWIADANYRRLRRGEEDLLLYVLILMKTHHPNVRLEEARRLDPVLFTPQALIEALYR